MQKIWSKPKVTVLVCLKLFLVIWASFNIIGCSSLNNEQKQLKVNDTVKSNLLETKSQSNDQKFSELKAEELELDQKKFMIVKINPRIYKLEILENSPSPNQKNIFELHKEKSSLLTFNGQFFTEKFKPTGLLISNGKTLNKSSKANLMNGVFAIDNQEKAKIYSNNEFQKLSKDQQKNLDFALQNGPLLIKNGKIQIKNDNKKTASRTTLGIDQEGNIILIILRQSIFNSENILSLYDFATFIQKKPELKNLNIIDLLNLDGGASTGFAIGEDYYPELSKVQNLILTKKRDL